MKGYNITEEAHTTAIIILGFGATSDIFEQLGSTGADYRRAQKQSKGIAKQVVHYTQKSMYQASKG